MYTAEVRVNLKKGVADPEGMNTRKALELLGFKDIASVSSVKMFRITLDAADEPDARKRTDDMCRRLLTNPVIHNYTIDIKAEG
jgi:phosphoribosylformylglycinamidine synthase PurS subunit